MLVASTRHMHLSRLASAALLALVAGLMPTTNAAASSVVRLDLPSLSERAELIVVARVEKTESRFITSKSQRIVTDVTLVAEQTVLGPQAATRFVVRHLGGEVGDIGQLVQGEASYAVGERVVVFAAERQGALFAVGMAQGVLHAYEDQNGVARVPPTFATRERSTEGHRVDELVEEVRALVVRKVSR